MKFPNFDIQKLLKTTMPIVTGKVVSNASCGQHHSLTTLDRDKTIAGPARWKLYLVSFENIPGNAGVM